MCYFYLTNGWYRTQGYEFCAHFPHQSCNSDYLLIKVIDYKVLIKDIKSLTEGGFLSPELPKPVFFKLFLIEAHSKKFILCTDLKIAYTYIHMYTHRHTTEMLLRQHLPLLHEMNSSSISFQFFSVLVKIH